MWTSSSNRTAIKKGNQKQKNQTNCLRTLKWKMFHLVDFPFRLWSNCSNKSFNTPQNYNIELMNWKLKNWLLLYARNEKRNSLNRSCFFFWNRFVCRLHSGGGIIQTLYTEIIIFNNRTHVVLDFVSFSFPLSRERMFTNHMFRCCFSCSSSIFVLLLPFAFYLLVLWLFLFSFFFYFVNDRMREWCYILISSFMYCLCVCCIYD